MPSVTPARPETDIRQHDAFWIGQVRRKCGDSFSQWSGDSGSPNPVVVVAGSCMLVRVSGHGRLLKDQTGSFLHAPEVDDFDLLGNPSIKEKQGLSVRLSEVRTLIKRFNDSSGIQMNGSTHTIVNNRFRINSER